MPGGQGLRHRTRDLFQRGFRQKGFINLSTYLRVYKLGDYVDIKMNPAVQKVGAPPGLPAAFSDHSDAMWRPWGRPTGVEGALIARGGLRAASRRFARAAAPRTHRRRRCPACAAEHRRVWRSSGTTARLAWSGT